MSNDKSIRASVKDKRRRSAAQENMRRQAVNRRKRVRADEFSALVARMTNRERHRWARAKYPGLRKREIEPLWQFVSPEQVKKMPRAPKCRRPVVLDNAATGTTERG